MSGGELQKVYLPDLFFTVSLSYMWETIHKYVCIKGELTSWAIIFFLDFYVGTPKMYYYKIYREMKTYVLGFNNFLINQNRWK